MRISIIILALELITSIFVLMNLYAAENRDRYHFSVLLYVILAIGALVPIHCFCKIPETASFQLESVSILILLMLFSSGSIVSSLRNSTSSVHVFSVREVMVREVAVAHCFFFCIAAGLQMTAVLHAGYAFAAVALFLLVLTSLLLRTILHKDFLFLNRRIREFEKKNMEDISFPANDDEAYKAIYDALVQKMVGEQWFLEHDLNITSVAQRLLTNRTYLSRAVNLYYKDNFHKFVNRYRVDYAMKLFNADPALRVSELADKSGFNVLPSFTVAFKAVVGCTPAEWCRSVRNNQTGTLC